MAAVLVPAPPVVSASPVVLRRWRSESRRVRVGLWVVLLVAAGVMAWNLGRTGDFEFYGAAARSMSVSWRAFLFGAEDPAATVTLDKLSGFLVPQALSARLFGFSWAAVAVPQLLEGLAAIWCCATIALRIAGARAGLIAAAAAASTPIFLSMFARPMEDGLLTAALAAALLFFQRAVVTGRVWPLLICGLLVGVGFQAKMLQAWLILPALLLGLLPVSRRLRTLLARSGVVVGTAVVGSLAWMSWMQVQPVGARPWFDGSVRNNVFDTVFVYNGVDRLFPVRIPGRSSDPLTTDMGRLLHSLPLAGAVPAQLSPVKLLLPYYTTQIGWLYPLALAGLVLLVAGVVRRRQIPRPVAAVLIAVTVWLVVTAAVLSRSGLAHTAYVAAIGVQLVLLAAVGIEEAVRLRVHPHPAARFVLPVLVVVEAVWSLLLAAPNWLPVPLLVLLIALSVVGIGVVVLPKREAAAAPVVPTAVTVVALLAGAITWSLQSADPARAGTGGDAYVGAKAAIAGQVAAAVPWDPQRPAPWGGVPVLPAVLADVVQRTAPLQQAGQPLLAADSERLSSVIIQDTGREVLTDGGYSGGVPVLTVQHLHTRIRQGHLTWLLTFLHPPRADAVDRVAPIAGCHKSHTWPPVPASRLLGHGLALWHCTARATPSRQPELAADAVLSARTGPSWAPQLPPRSSETPSAAHTSSVPVAWRVNHRTPAGHLARAAMRSCRLGCTGLLPEVPPFTWDPDGLSPLGF